MPLEKGFVYLILFFPPALKLTRLKTVCPFNFLSPDPLMLPQLELAKDSIINKMSHLLLHTTKFITRLKLQD